MRLAVALILIGVVVLVATGRAEQPGTAVVLDIKGAIGPATSDYIARGLDQARERKAGLVILRIDTPGGLDSAMRDIIKAILASPVPVIGFVAPSGARAASAGTYILYATQIAAMAPGTDLGAATPVQMGGPGQPQPAPNEPKKSAPPEAEKDKIKDKTKDKDGKKEASGEAKTERRSGHPTMRDKAVNEAIAYIRGLADMRGRNADWAEEAVRDAASLPAQDALKRQVIDLIATDIPDLLKQIDGRTVEVAGKARRLETTTLRLEVIQPDWRNELLGILTNPNVAYILMIVGIYGIIFEFYSPGMILPGTVGAISLLLAMYAFNLLPVNYAGLALILLGTALMVSEAFVPSFGVLGIGGIVAFVIGSIMLMDTDVPGFEIYWPLIGGIAVVSAGLFLFVVLMMVRARGRAVVSGPEEMVGSTGEVLSWSGTGGRVRAHGEVWQARATVQFEPGSRIRVQRLDGLTLLVEPDPNRR